MLSVCSKHLPQESKFQQKLAEMSEYYFFINCTAMSALDKTVYAHSDKNIAQHRCHFSNSLSFLYLLHLILKMQIIKWKSSKAILRILDGTAA